MSECPSCESEVDYVMPGDGKCESCGLLYIGVQEGETYSEGDHQIPVWETCSNTLKSFFGVTDEMFRKHQMKKERP